MKKINIGEKAQVEVVLEIFPSQYSREEELNIIHKVAKKYGISPNNVKVNVQYKNISGNTHTALNNKNIENIHDPKFQHTLFDEYIKERGIDMSDYDYDEILKIDSQINSQIDYSKYETGRKYTLNWLKWNNFLSYGKDNYINFKDLHGLILLNSEPANQGGKSTFAYDLLHFLFFAKTRSGKAKTLDKMFNSFLPDENEVIVEGSLTIDGQEYIIKRKLIRPSKEKKTKQITQSVEYYKVLDGGVTELLDDIDNCQDESTTKTNKIIKEAIGNEDDFDMIVSANSKDLDTLISMKETEKGKILYKWNGLSVIDDKFAIAKETYNNIAKTFSSQKYSREELKTDIEQYQENIKKCQDEINKSKQIIDESSNTLNIKNKEKETLLESKQIIDKSLSNLDIKTQKVKLETIKENGKTLRSKETLAKEKLIQYNDLTEPYETYKEKADAIMNEKLLLTKKITESETNIKHLKKVIKELVDGEYCPYCKRKYDDGTHDHSKEIKENQDKLNILTVNLDNDKIAIFELEKSYNELNNTLIRYNEKNKLEISTQTIANKIEEQLSQYKKQAQIVKDLESNADAIAKNNEIDNNINIINSIINVEEKRKMTASNNIIFNQKDIERYEEKIRESNSIISKIEQEIKTQKNWKLYLDMIGKDGISKMVLKNTIPIINNELEILLSDVCDFSVKLEINDKNDIEMLLISDGVKTLLTAGSGYERCLAAIALRVVLGNMSKLSKPPFILFDEILGTVAKSNYESVKKLYMKVLKYYDFIFQITHLEDIIEWHDTIITIEKKDHISKIKKISKNDVY